MSDKKTTKPLSMRRINALKALCRKATPPPWEDERDSIGSEDGYEIGRSYRVVARENGTICYLHSYLDYPGNDKADAAFIAAVRQAVPELLAEVERLKAENQRLEQAANWLADILEEYTDCCPLRFALENCETSRVPKVDGCEGTWPVGDYFHCLVRRENKKCWVEAAVKVTSDDGNHER